jgi:hypothetical protein
MKCHPHHYAPLFWHLMNNNVLRMVFHWLVLGPVLPMNPAAAVRGHTHVVKTGKTAVLDGSEWRRLLDAIPTDTVRDRRDRALIATLIYSFARISAALKMKVDDLRARGAGGSCACARKAVSSTSSRGTTNWPRSCARISTRPTLPKNAKVGSSPPPRAGTQAPYHASR